MSDSVRSRSRSPVSIATSSEDETKVPKHRKNPLNFNLLFLYNAPEKWNWEDCRRFLLQHISPITDMPYINSFMDGFKLKFKGPKPCTKGLMLNGLTAEGKTIKVERFSPKTEHTRRKYVDIPKKLIKIDDSSSHHPHETYGLSLDFLQQLNISLPLKSNIFVNNLPTSITEENLKQVFSLAGDVVSLRILRFPGRSIGKIAYDHPVEAVQAISLFHGQTLHSRKMLVQIDNKELTQVLPDGLESIGRGLGTNGEPLKSIRTVVQIEPLKQFITQEIMRLTNCNTAATGATMVNDPSFMANAMQSYINPFNMGAMNQVQAPAMYGMNMMQAGTAWQGLLQKCNGNDLTAMAAYQVQNSVNNMNEVTTVIKDQPAKNSTEKDKGSMSSDLLVFKNLPKSVTGHALKKKMNEVGKVVFTEVTGEGRAIVRFSDSHDALRCIKLFDHTKVDGQLIQVNFL